MFCFAGHCHHKFANKNIKCQMQGMSCYVSTHHENMNIYCVIMRPNQDLNTCTYKILHKLLYWTDCVATFYFTQL